MPEELYFFPSTIEPGDYELPDGGTALGLRLTNDLGQAVNVLFRPEALERFLQQLAALRDTGGCGKPN